MTTSNPLAAVGSTLLSAFGIGDGAVQDARAQLTSGLGSNALQDAAAYGKPGQALQNTAAGLQSQSANLDWSRVNADDQRLAAVRAHYLDQFRNGGLAGQAAVNAAQNARGLNAQGGVAGIRGDTLQSGDAQARVADVAQNEMTQAGDAANSLDTQKAAMALRQAVLAAQVSHDNLSNHLKANQVGFDLQNNQSVLSNQAQQELNDLSNRARGDDIDHQAAMAKLGQELLTGLFGAASGGLGTAVNAASATDAQPAATGTVATAAPQIVSSNTGTGAGYIQPAATMGRGAVTTPAYTPIFQTPPTLPTTSNYFDRGRG